MEPAEPWNHIFLVKKLLDIYKIKKKPLNLFEISFSGMKKIKLIVNELEIIDFQL